MYNEALIKELETNLERQQIYMNDEGGWLFRPHPLFPIELTREDILGKKTKKAEVTEETTNDEEAIKTTKKTNKK